MKGHKEYWNPILGRPHEGVDKVCGTVWHAELEEARKTTLLPSTERGTLDTEKIGEILFKTRAKTGSTHCLKCKNRLYYYAGGSCGEEMDFTPL